MTRTRIALAAAIVALAMPASALAKSNFTIRGAGFGHGVGMSQYGAMGYAEHGWTAPAILRHYFSGTSLGKTDPGQIVRVLLASGSSADISGASQAGARKLDPGATYTVRRAGVGQVALLRGSRKVATFTAPLQIAGSHGLIALAGHGSYRGVLEIHPGLANGIDVVDAVDLEDYVRGVVPRESPASWPIEALKAQAIAARTYAITTGQGGEFDQYADTRSQVYGGASAETQSTDEAVADTRGQVVTYRGKPVVTYFFSTSGGRTESVENVFGGSPKPWLKSVADPYDSVSPRHRWTPVTMSLGRAGAKLGDLVSGSFRGIVVTRRGESPRIVDAEVVGSRGRTRVSGATLRARLDLPDTWAYFTTITSRRGTARASAADVAPNPQALDSLDRTRATLSARSRGSLEGSVLPARRGGKLEIQRRAGGRWVTAGRAKVRSGGGYAFTIRRSGTYRVLYAGAKGPSIGF